MDFPEGQSHTRVPFEGSYNFRDFGGYHTTDGRRMKRRLLYRSDRLSKLTDTDLVRFSQLGIRVVCDFRSPKERAAAPNRLPEVDPPRTELLSIYNSELDNTEVLDRLRWGKLDGLDLEEYMLEGYRNVDHATPHYKRLFEMLIDPSCLPLLIHCTGGKDRTGRAAAMIQCALGVPEETIVHDFMLSNVYLGDRTQSALEYFWEKSNFRTHPDAARPLLEVREQYLQTTFAALKKEYASVDGYLRDAVGLVDSARAELQHVLLE